MDEIKLSADEVKLAKELNFSEEALKIVKAETESTLTKVDMTKGLTEQKGTLVEETKKQRDALLAHINERRDPLIATLKKIKKQYPELSSKIDPELEKLQKPSPMEEQIKRNAEMRIAMAPYVGYIQQEIERGKPAKGYRTWTMVEPDRTPEEVANELKKEYEGKPLDDKYREKPPELAVRFYIPFDDSMRSTMRKYNASVTESTAMRPVIERLKSQLEPLGYDVFGGPERMTNKTVYTAKEADELKASALPQELIEIKVYQGLKYKRDANFSSDVPGILGRQFIEPDNQVAKQPDGTWLITEPDRHVVNSRLLHGFLVKRSEFDQIDFVEFAGTNPINYGLKNSDVTEKLRDWHKQYGIEVINATGDSMIVRFKNIPDDIRPLCDELWRLCPEIFDVSNWDEPLSDEQIERFARDFKKTHEVSFWWD